MTPYEVVTTGAQLTGCKYKWTVTNGSFHNGIDNTRNVTVTWNNTTNPGTLSVTLTSCTQAENTTVTETYIIRSVNGVSPSGFELFNGPLPLCNSGTISARINKIFVPGTPSGYILAKEVDGYEWQLEYPDEWILSPSYETALITPHPNFATCSKGTVKVRGYIDCGGTRRYSNWSSNLTLRTVPQFQTRINNATSHTIICGNTDEVQLSVQQVACATGYQWTFPPGWKDAFGNNSPVTTLGAQANSLIISPDNDATPPFEDVLKGDVVAQINLGCGAPFPSVKSTIIYDDPDLANPVFTSSSVQLLCGLSSGTVAVNPIPNAATYTWYTYGPGLKVNGISATSTSPVTTTTPSVTLSLNRSAGENDIVYVKASRSNTCAGSALKFRNLWLGKPMPVDEIAQGLDAAGPFYLCANQTYQFNAFDYNNFSPVTNYTWSVSPNHTIQSYSGSGNITANIKLGNTVNNTSVSVYASNSCGLSTTKTVNLYQSLVGCGGQVAFSVFPNPTTDYIEIEYTGEDPGEYEIQITDDNGKEKVRLKTNKKNNSVSTRAFTKGVYIVKIKSDGHEHDYRIIKE